MNRIALFVVIAIAGIVSLMFLPRRSEPIKYINPLDYQFKPIFKPQKPDTIIQWLKPDTVLREKIVQGDVVVKIETRDRWLGVQTIDTKGIVSEEKYKIPRFAEMKIDTAGNVRFKRKVLPRVFIAVGIAAAGFFTYLIIKNGTLD